jgi:hypothetical protein
VSEAANFAEIRLILLREWDPIGITHGRNYDEATDDEYDSYAREIAAMLARGASFEDVFAYLKWGETEHMQLPFSEAKAFRSAQLIVRKSLAD